MNNPKEVIEKYGVMVYIREKVKSKYPVILDADYEVGFKERYFCKNITSNENIIEIDKKTYEILLNKDSKYPYELYNITKIIWKLIGPYKDTTIGNRILYGVFDTNFRSVMKVKKDFPGIENKLTDLTEFSIITLDNKPNTDVILDDESKTDIIVDNKSKTDVIIVDKPKTDVIISSDNKSKINLDYTEQNFY